MPRVDRPFCIIGVQKHTQTINENAVPNTLSIDRATPTPSHNMDVCMGENENTIEGEGVTIENEHEAPEGDAAERKVCHTDHRHAHRTSVASKNIDALQPRKLKDPEVNDGNDKQPTLEQIRPQERNLGKPVRRSNDAKGDEVETRDIAVEWIVWHKQNNGCTDYIYDGMDIGLKMAR